MNSPGAIWAHVGLSGSISSPVTQRCTVTGVPGVTSRTTAARVFGSLRTLAVRRTSPCHSAVEDVAFGAVVVAGGMAGATGATGATGAVAVVGLAGVAAGATGAAGAVIEIGRAHV